ncbi:MAG: hypothetical protein L6420_05505 [Elusimicrobia bacterium]|nr:hypothetical protein [Elusimicrobiota bacterium]
MAEQENKKIKKLSWKEKFYASRAVFESIMFEKELSAPKKDKTWIGLLGLFAIVFIGVLFFSIGILGQDYVFSLKDAINVNIIISLTENFLAGNWIAIFNPEVIGITNLQPPFYFINYYPFLQLFPDNFNIAIICVNSFYLAILAFSVFSLASWKRNYKSGWLAAAVACTMPFVLEVVRHPSPEIAVIAFVALAYAGFINSEEFEKDGKWGFIYGVALAFGLFTDKFFLIYILPTLLTFISALLSPIARGRVFKGFIIAAALNIPWYLRNAFYIFIMDSFSGSEAVYLKAFHLKNLLWYLGSAASSSHLILFFLGALALLWMYYAVFMPYEGKAAVFMWFLIPYICFTFLFANDPANFYPALIAFAIAIGVMTPNKIRNYFFGGLALLFIINQTNIISAKSISLFGKNIPIVGLPAPLNSTAKMGDIIDFINERSRSISSVRRTAVGQVALAGKKTALQKAQAGRQVWEKFPVKISVIDKNNSFNIPSFSLYAEKKGMKNLKFSPYNSSLIGLSDFIIVKSGSSLNSRFLDINKKWFSKIFAEIKSYQLEDMSTVIVYQKKNNKQKHFENKSYEVKKLKLAGFVFENIVLKLSDFDKSEGAYKKVLFFSPYASLGEIDIYGLNGIIEDFSFIPLKEGDLSDIIPIRIGKLKILSAKISNYSIARYIESKNSYLRDVEVRLDKNFEIMAFIGKTEIFLEFLFKYSNGKFIFYLYDLVYSRISMPNFILKIFHFEYSLDTLPFKMDFNKVVIRKSMMEIS